MIAKLEIIKPISVFVTPKVLAKIGIAGIIRPKPIATKNEIMVSTDTSWGSPAKGDFSFKLSTLLQHLVWRWHAHGYPAEVSLEEIAQRKSQLLRRGRQPRRLFGTSS
jgi:hypothetical protein